MGTGIKFVNEISDTTAKTADMKTKIYIPSDNARWSLMNNSNLSWEKIASYYRPSSGIEDWRKLHGPKNWRKGYSAYETANSWEKSQPDLPPKIAALLCGSAKLLAAIPEHKTRLPGRGKSSQTDVLAFIRVKNRVCAVAVEGKKDEHFGKLAGKWLKGASAGKRKRLKYIADKLGLSYPPPGDIRYQLLHRTVTAVIEADNFHSDCAAMIVQSFSPKYKRFGDFQKFLNLFGIDPVTRDKIYKADKPGMPLYFGWASP